MKSKILWTERTLNVFTGCTHCSPGCDHCYAERMTRRLCSIERSSIKYKYGFSFRSHIYLSSLPYSWEKPSKIFVNSMSDTFHEGAQEWEIKHLFKVMNECYWHTFQLLTKRPQNIPEGLNWSDNIHLGVTVCTQKEAIEKIPLLIKVPAKKRFLSIEPMLENVYIEQVFWKSFSDTTCGSKGAGGQLFTHQPSRHIDLVIVGGESGPGARPMHPDWVRSIRDQCAGANVPFVFKQWGEWCYADQMPGETYRRIDASPSGAFTESECFNKPGKVGKKLAGRELDGIIHDGDIK